MSNEDPRAKREKAVRSVIAEGYVNVLIHPKELLLAIIQSTPPEYTTDFILERYEVLIRLIAAKLREMEERKDEQGK
jgi:hypothetical protein